MAEDEQGKKKPARPFIKPLAYRPTDAARRAGIGRTKLYELMDKGELPSHKEGRMRSLTKTSRPGFGVCRPNKHPHLNRSDLCSAMRRT